MNTFKKIFIFYLIATLLFFGFKYFKNDKKAIIKAVNQIDSELKLSPEKNIMKQAISILKILDHFEDNFKGSIEHVNITNKRELKELVSWVKQSLSPMEIKIEYENFKMNKPNASVALNIEILNSQQSDIHKKNYNLSLIWNKHKGKWRITEAYEDKITEVSG